MKAFFVVLVAFLFVTTSFGQIQKETVNGWYIVDTLNVWEASSRINIFGGVPQGHFADGDNYQIFRLKTYDAGKPSYVEFERKIPKTKTPIGFIWFSGLVKVSPEAGYARYLFSIGNSSGWYDMEQPYQFRGGEPFVLIESEGYFRTAVPDSIDRIRIRVYPAPYSGNVVRFMELGFDFLRGIKENGDYFLLDPFEDTTVVGVEDEPSLPKSFHLSQNYPNPFNPQTSIRYTVLSSKYVNLTVYNVLGQKVKTLVDEEKFPGEYTISFDGSNLSSGIYFYRLTAGQYTETKKMILQK